MRYLQQALLLCLHLVPCCPNRRGHALQILETMRLKPNQIWKVNKGHKCSHRGKWRHATDAQT